MSASKAAAKKASGRNIPEAQRSTYQVKLRVSRATVRSLDELANLRGTTRSAALAWLLDITGSHDLWSRGACECLVCAPPPAEPAVYVPSHPLCTPVRLGDDRVIQAGIKRARSGSR